MLSCADYIETSLQKFKKYEILGCESLLSPASIDDTMWAKDIVVSGPPSRHSTCWNPRNINLTCSPDKIEAGQSSSFEIGAGGLRRQPRCPLCSTTRLKQIWRRRNHTCRTRSGSTQSSACLLMIQRSTAEMRATRRDAGRPYSTPSLTALSRHHISKTNVKFIPKPITTGSKRWCLAPSHNQSDWWGEREASILPGGRVDRSPPII